MVVVLEHCEHVSRRMAQLRTIYRTAPDLLSQNIAEEVRHIMAGHNTGSAKFERPVSQPVFGQRYCRDIGHIPVIHTTDTNR